MVPAAVSPASDAKAPRPADAILVVDDVSKRFDTAEGPIVAVDHMSFNVAPGEFLAVIGPSGCGKSTLFNVIGGLVDNYDGRITVAGETVSGPHAAIGMRTARDTFITPKPVLRYSEEPDSSTFDPALRSTSQPAWRL